jgi:RNA-directed DNA polymerase
LKKVSPCFQHVFDSTFHHKLSFDDFLSFDVEQECKKFTINQKLILNPSAKLKKYHRFLNSFIFDYAKVNTNVVHSYRREKNAYTAVIKHAKSKYFFQTDIKNFFNSITTLDIENILDKNLSDVPVSDITNYKGRLLSLTTKNGFLPVGFSTSPNISNTCLYAFDNSLEEYCLSQDIIYTRYSDDIILSSNNKESLNNIENVISEKLKLFFSDRIQLNLHKTKHTHKGEKIKLLGMVILPSGHVSVDIKLKKQLEILFHFYINDKIKFADYLKNHYHGDLSKISGQLNHINTIDSSYLNKLRKKYGNSIVDIFYHIDKTRKFE